MGRMTLEIGFTVPAAANLRAGLLTYKARSEKEAKINQLQDQKYGNQK